MRNGSFSRRAMSNSWTSAVRAPSRSQSATYAGTVQDTASARIPSSSISSPIARASTSMSKICSIVLVPCDQYAAARTVASPRRSPLVRASSIGLVTYARGGRPLPLEVERSRKSAEQAHLQLRTHLVEPGCCLLEQLDGSGVDDGGTPAGFLESDRGPHE